MKYCVLFVLSLQILNACTDNPSDCINTMIEEFKKQHQDRGFTFIYEFEQNGETFYIFDSGIAFDAIATVLNSDCETVCIYGGLRVSDPMPCEEYQNGINNASQIWPE